LVLFVAKHSLDSISLEIVNRHALSCACTSDRECSTRAREACTSDRQPVNGNSDSDSCLCERSPSVLHTYAAAAAYSVRLSAEQAMGQPVNASDGSRFGIVHVGHGSC